MAAQNWTPKLQCRHDSQELHGVDVIAETVKNWGWEGRVEEPTMKYSASTSVTGVGGEMPRVIEPRRRFDEGHTVVEWKEMTPPTEV